MELDKELLEDMQVSGQALSFSEIGSIILIFFCLDFLNQGRSI